MICFNFRRNTDRSDCVGCRSNLSRIATRIDRGSCSHQGVGFHDVNERRPLKTLYEFCYRVVEAGSNSIAIESDTLLPVAMAIPVKLLTDLVFEVADDGVFICSCKYFFDDRFWRIASPRSALLKISFGRFADNIRSVSNCRALGNQS